MALVLWGAGILWNLLSGASRKSADELLVQALPRPEIARLLSLGFEAFEGDLYWVGALQYSNSPSKSVARECYPQLKDYLALSTTLAPDFVSAYRMAGIAIPCNAKNGWRNLDESNALVSKGLERFPENWFLGLLYSNNLVLQNRHGDAARVMAHAAKQPGAPAHFAGLATRLMATSGDVDAALLMAENLLASASDAETKNALRDRVAMIRHVFELKRLRRAVLLYHEKHVQWPASLGELTATGLIEGVPEEPLGGEWIYDGATGNIRASTPTPKITIFAPEARQ